MAGLLNCKLNSPDFIRAVLSLSQLRSGEELECYQPLRVTFVRVFFSGGSGVSLSLSLSQPSTLSRFVFFFFLPAVAAVWWSPSVLKQPASLTMKCDQKASEHAFNSYLSLPLVPGWSCGRKMTMLTSTWYKLMRVSVKTEGCSPSWNLNKTPSLTRFLLQIIGSLGIVKEKAPSAEVGAISCSALPPSTFLQDGGDKDTVLSQQHLRDMAFPGNFHTSIDPAQSCLACGIRQDHSMKLCGCSVRQRNP